MLLRNNNVVEDNVTNFMALKLAYAHLSSNLIGLEYVEKPINFVLVYTCHTLPWMLSTL